jgi:hypothetical protein
MLNISYAPQDAALAEKIQRDLSESGLWLDHPMLIVLVSPDTIADKTILHSIRIAQREKHAILPILLHAAPLPQELSACKPLDLSRGYDLNRLIQAVKRADLGEARRRANLRLLFWVSSAALIVFLVAIGTLVTGTIAPPTDEYATENALREGQIATIIFPTLDAFMPRTTEDALQFPATLEALQTRVMPFLMLSATALPQSQKATQDALATSIVATETARAAGTAEAQATATPQP